MTSETKDLNDALEGASVGNRPVNRNVDFLPKVSTELEDKVLYEAWRDYMIAGFDQNKTMFKRVLNGFMRPYTITVIMYVVMFLIGIGGIVTAAALAVAKNVVFATVLGGLSVVTFLTFFISRPLAALEQNLLFITWLGMIYNTYWTRLMYTSDASTVQQDLAEIEKTALTELNRLVDKHEKLTKGRPGLTDEKSATPTPSTPIP
jgi:hypothetical protein